MLFILIINYERINQLSFLVLTCNHLLHVSNRKKMVWIMLPNAAYYFARYPNKEMAMVKTVCLCTVISKKCSGAGSEVLPHVWGRQITPAYVTFFSVTMLTIKCLKTGNFLSCAVVSTYFLSHNVFLSHGLLL